MVLFKNKMANGKIPIIVASPYINNLPYMGHIVEFHLPVDIHHKYCKVKGYDITFVCGFGERGTPTTVVTKELVK